MLQLCVVQCLDYVLGHVYLTSILISTGVELAIGILRYLGIYIMATHGHLYIPTELTWDIGGRSS